MIGRMISRLSDGTTIFKIYENNIYIGDYKCQYDNFEQEREYKAIIINEQQCQIIKGD